MSQPKRINKSLREVTAIWRAIQSGDEELAERCCVDHVKAAAVAALDMIARHVQGELALPTNRECSMMYLVRSLVLLLALSVPDTPPPWRRIIPPVRSR
jgi:hypothetical protein